MSQRTLITTRGLKHPLFLAVFLCLYSLSPVNAAFQEALWGARPASMAGAFTALADDANAPAYNPAGIALLQRNEMTIMYAQLFSGVNFQAANDTSRLSLGYFSFAPRIRDQKYGSYAFSWNNFSASNIYREDSFVFTYANSRQFETSNSQPVLAYGANLKMLRREFSEDIRTDADPVFRGGPDSSAMTADLGVIVRPDFAVLPGLKMGLVGQNITRPNIGLAKVDRVPSRYAVGFAYQDLDYKWFNPSLDFSRRDGKTTVAAAWEGWFAKNTLAFRLGGDDTQFTGGMGYQFMIRSFVMRLDYAVLWPMEIHASDGSHRISLTTSF